MNILIKFILLFLIINCTNCITIEFDISIIDNCTSSNPCSLSSSDVWVGKVAPATDVDIVIDFSSLKNGNNQEIYLDANKFSIELNSFSLNGGFVNGYYTNFLINSAQIVINGDFNITLSNATFIDSKLSINNLNLQNVSLLLNGQTNLQSNNLESIGEQSIVIQDQSYVTVDTQSNINSPIYHYSQNQLVLDGQSQIFQNVISNGTVQFGSVTVNGANVDLVNLELLSNTSSISIINNGQLQLMGTVNGQSVLSNTQIVLNKNGTLILPSGYTIENITTQNDGQIIIQDSKSKSVVNNVNSLYLTIYVPGTLDVSNSKLQYVELTTSSSELNFVSNSTITYFNGNGTVIVQESATVIVGAESKFYNMSIYGTLEVRSNLYGNYINVYPSGYLYTYSFAIYANIMGNKANIDIGKSQEVDSISLTQSTIVIGQPGLYINDLELKYYSTLAITNLVLNDNVAAIIFNSSISIDSSCSLDLQFAYTNQQISNGDKIFVFNTQTVKDSNVAFGNIKVLNIPLDIQYKLYINNEGCYIEFTRGTSGSGDNSSNNSENSSNSESSDEGSNASKIGLNLLYLIILILVKLFV